MFASTKLKKGLLLASALGVGSALSMGVRSLRGDSPEPGAGFKRGLGLGSAYFYLAPFIGRLVDPETAHSYAIRVLSLDFRSRQFLGLVSGDDGPAFENLRTTVFGREFKNPIGIAAGFDKNGEAIAGLFDCGFGFVEVGSVTPAPQPGNEKPRVFRLSEDQAIINRYGFNSHGIKVVGERLKAFYESEAHSSSSSSSSTGLLGVNVGKNASSPNESLDFQTGIEQLGEYADYLVINISSPNTAGLRDFHHSQKLIELIHSCQKSRNSLVEGKKNEEKKKYIPLLVKISPDLSLEQCKEISKIALETGLDGLIVSNTTIQRPDSLKASETVKAERGGLSGAPLFDRSTHLLSAFYHYTHGKIPIIGSGGIFTGRQILEKIESGASLVQLYTSFAYYGPQEIIQLKSELSRELKQSGYSTIHEAIGKKKYIEREF